MTQPGVVRSVLLALFGLILTSRAQAQESVREVVTFLMTNQAVETGDFERDRTAAETASDTIARALLVNLTSLPIATSSSGFLYRLNPELGTVERVTESFGGFFVERALTSGPGRTSFGISATTSGFDSLDGEPLRNGTLVTIANQFRDEAVPFDTESLTLRVRTSTLTVFASVGIGDRVEIGAAVPMVRLTLEGERVNVYRGDSFVQARASSTASGIADVALRAKATLLTGRRGGLAAAGELRLPTGSEDNLLGAGAASWRLTGIGSLENGRFSLHGNAGVVRGGLSESGVAVSDEVTFGVAASVAARPRLTISGEMFGRHIPDLNPILLSRAPHPTIVGVDTFRLSTGASAATLITAIASLKWNVSGTVVIGGHVGVPLTDRGLTAPLTPTVAVEVGF